MRTEVKKINVNLNIPIETKGKYCGYCRFYNSWHTRCILFDKKLEEFVVDSSEWIMPIIDEIERCDECIQAEVKE